MADHFLIPQLHSLCNEFVKRTITRTNALPMLKKALEFQVQEVIEIASNVISKNFYLIPKDEFLSLPFSSFSKILHHKYLAIKEEMDLYNIVCMYIKNDEELSEEQIRELFESVRFPLMSFAQLNACEANPLVPRYLIIEAIMTRLKKYECPDRMHEDANSPRNQKRISCASFEYQSDFDDRGIIHYLATNGNTEPYKNPHLSGKIKVTSSSIEVGNAPDLLSKTPSELWTKDVPSSWFTIDFGTNRSVLATCYTLRHGGNYRADSLRTWDLQGSTDGKNWTVLKHHLHDTSLTDKFATHTWRIDGSKLQEYRYFRILQTGRNSSNHNFLVLSGVEFYGDLYEWKDD